MCWYSLYFTEYKLGTESEKKFFLLIKKDIARGRSAI